MFVFFLFPVKEGCFLYNNGINPYTGDNYHENPLILVATNFLINSFEYLIPLIFILLDLLGSLMLHQAATKFVQEMVNFIQIIIFFKSYLICILVR